MALRHKLFGSHPHMPLDGERTPLSLAAIGLLAIPIVEEDHGRQMGQ
jgi:hypothetical protein